MVLLVLICLLGEVGEVVGEVAHTHFWTFLLGGQGGGALPPWMACPSSCGLLRLARVDARDWKLALIRGVSPWRGGI